MCEPAGRKERTECPEDWGRCNREVWGPQAVLSALPTPRPLGGKEAQGTHDSGVPKPGTSGSIWIWELPLDCGGLLMDTGCLSPA